MYLSAFIALLSSRWPKKISQYKLNTALNIRKISSYTLLALLTIFNIRYSQDYVNLCLTRLILIGVLKLHSLLLTS